MLNVNYFPFKTVACVIFVFVVQNVKKNICECPLYMLIFYPKTASDAFKTVFVFISNCYKLDRL